MRYQHFTREVIIIVNMKHLDLRQVNVIAYRTKVITNGQIDCDHRVRTIFQCFQIIVVFAHSLYFSGSKPHFGLILHKQVQQLGPESKHVLCGHLGFPVLILIVIRLYCDSQVRLYLCPGVRIIFGIINIRFKDMRKDGVVLYFSTEYCLI